MGLILHFTFGFNHDNDTQNMMIFILLLESIMPPTQNSVLMFQVAEKAKETSQLARFLCSNYIFSMIPIVLIGTLLLERLKILTVH